MVSPSAGELIKSRCVVVMRGGRKPLVVLSTCSLALAACEPSATPTPTELLPASTVKQLASVSLSTRKSMSLPGALKMTAP